MPNSMFFYSVILILHHFIVNCRYFSQTPLVSRVESAGGRLRTSSLGRSGDWAGKGRRACNLVSRIGISASKASMLNADWQEMTKVMTSLPLACASTCFFMFVYIRVRFPFTLIGASIFFMSVSP